MSLSWLATLRRFLLWTLLLALFGYLLAWGLSLALDQPFAPVLVLCSLGSTVIVRGLRGIGGLP